MLNMKKIELEIIQNLHMHIFFQKDIRVGISHTSNRCCKDNNKYFTIINNSQQESRDITELDSDNLYGFPMSKFLLTS